MVSSCEVVDNAVALIQTRYFSRVLSFKVCVLELGNKSYKSCTLLLRMNMQEMLNRETNVVLGTLLFQVLSDDQVVLRSRQHERSQTELVASVDVGAVLDEFSGDVRVSY